MNEDMFNIKNAAELAGEKGKVKSERGPRPYSEKSDDEEDKPDVTTQQELYCAARADGHGKARSYMIAFPNCNSGHGPSATKLESQDKIKLRIQQLREERAWAAKLVDPQESLIRWNEIYLEARKSGDKKTMIEAQKQIDKINGADAAIVRQQLEVKGLFRGEEDEWKDNAAKLLAILKASGLDLPTKTKVK